MPVFIVTFTKSLNDSEPQDTLVLMWIKAISREDDANDEISFIF